MVERVFLVAEAAVWKVQRMLRAEEPAVVPWPEPCHTLTGYWYTAGWDSRTGKWYAKCYLGHVLRGRTGRD